jgi:hypothetical protein
MAANRRTGSVTPTSNISWIHFKRRPLSCFGVVLTGVAALAALEASQQHAAGLPDMALELPGRLLREHRQQHLLDPGMVRRVDADRRRQHHLLWPVIAHDHPARGKHLPIEHHLARGLVGRGEVDAEHAVGMRDRAAAADFLQDRGGVVDPRGMGGVEIGSPVGNRLWLVQCSRLG